MRHEYQVQMADRVAEMLLKLVMIDWLEIFEGVSDE